MNAGRLNRWHIVAVIVIALCLVGISIGIGYVIGRAIKTKEIEDKQSPDSSSVNAIIEKHKLLREEAVRDVSTSNLRENLRYYTRQPHSPGSKESYDLALQIKEKWLEYGFDKVELKKYNVLLSVPEKAGEVTVHYANGTKFYQTQRVDATMDPAYNDSRVFPPFSAYSKAGTVTGKLVFANYGKYSDYQTLKDKNISVAGKIVITRFGGSSRVFQHGRAYKAGAIGLIIYMDPANYAKKGVDKVYPDYNWMPKHGVQRGTLKYSAARGDPLTPGYPAVDGMYRLSIDEAKKDLPQIPVQPMSYSDAEPLLRMLKGSVGKSGWQGGLDFTYGVEMDENDDRNVTLTVNTVLKPFDIYNVIGTIQGTVEPDHLVLLGNHRDAWVYGAADASSGTSAMMETSRVIGNMMKKGWKPRRSLVFCSWGAEEPQLMGSAEWMEDYARLLHRRAVAYLNVDMSVDGAYSFRAKSMPTMDWILFEATKQIPSPLGNETIFEEWRRKLPDNTDRYEVKGEVPSVQQIRSGSDYAVFYQRLGIPCVDIRYTYDRKTSGNPLYHTIYDNFHMMSKLMDPEFKYHQVTTRAWTQIALVMSDSFIIPFNATNYGRMLKYYSARIEGKYGKAFETNNVSMVYLNYAIGNFTETAKKFHKTIDEADLNKQNVLDRINARLVNLERAFIDDSPIIPSKPLQRHVVLAPGVRRYSSWMAGVVEAIYDAEYNISSWEGVKKQISVVQYAVESASHLLNMSPI